MGLVIKKYLFIILLVGFCHGQTEKIITRWEDGTPKKINYYDGKGFDKVLVGVKTYYSNGDLRSKTRYKDNVQDGFKALERMPPEHKVTGSNPVGRTR